MTESTESILWQRVRAVEPTAAQKAAAARSHTHLRELLAGGQIGRRITTTYLSGSYARDTAIRPIDDVDVIFEIDPSQWDLPFYGFGHLPQPSAVLESFAGSIRYRYPVSSVYGQRRSVRLDLFHLSIDVVPAVAIDGHNGFIWIPDRQANDWIKSSPKRHAAMATAVNQQREGRFKPLVKLLKYWNQHLPSTIQTRSFLLETMAVHLFQSLPLPSLTDGLVYFWDFLAAQGRQTTLYRWGSAYGMTFGALATVVPDVAGTGTNVAAGIAQADIYNLAAKARISRDSLQAATKARLASAAAAHVGAAFRQ